MLLTLGPLQAHDLLLPTISPAYSHLARPEHCLKTGLHPPLSSTVLCEALLLGHLVHGGKLAGKLCLLADDLKLGLQEQTSEYHSSCMARSFWLCTLRWAPLTSELLLTWNSTCD